MVATQTKVEIVNVTPQMAEQWLANPAQNRYLSLSRMTMWARAMSNGQWQLNNDAICFDPEGRLNNGQHRLRAVILSNTTQPFVILHGISMENIDTGRKRSFANVLQIMGFKNTTALSAGLMLLYGLREKAFAGNNIKKSGRPSTEDLLKLFHEIEEEVKYAAHRATSIAVFGVPSAFTAWYVLAARQNKELADKFVDQLRTGENINRDMPVYLLREALRMNRDQYGRDNIRIFALYLKAWEATLKGETLTRLQWSERDPFPYVEF